MCNDRLSKWLEQYDPFKSFLDYFSDIVVIFDLERNVLDANGNLKEITGVEIDEMKARSAYGTMSKKYQEQAITSFDAALKGVVKEEEVRIVNKENQPKYLKIKHIPIVVEGDIVGVYGVGIDITEEKQRNLQLKEINDELNLILNNTSDAIFLLAHDGSILKTNDRYKEILGWNEDELRSGMPVNIPEDFKEDKQHLLNRLQQGESISNHEVQRLHKDGNVIDILASYQPIKNEHAVAIGMYKDNSEQKRLRRELEENEQRYRSLYANNSDAIYSLDSEGKFIDCNLACSQMSGYTNDELKEMQFHSLIVIDDLQETVHHFEEAKKGRTQNYEITIINKNRERLNINITNIPIKINGEVKGVFGIAKDITKEKKAEEKIKFMAYYDQLTELPNRSLFKDRTIQAWKHTRKQKDSMAVMFIDLDGFKLVNDSLGHDCGDHLLTRVAARLQPCLEPDQTLARMGGDEFTVLLPEVDSHDVVETVAKKIIKVLEQPFMFDEIAFHVTASIGIAFYDGEEEIDVNTLIKQADTAMYSIKEQGKNDYRFYHEDMDKESLRKVIMENDFRSALDKNEFVLDYQPIVNLQTGKIISTEALVRWDNKELGRISPGEFIPLAEEKGLIIPLGEWVLKEACTQCKKWHDEGLPQIKVSVNVSVRQLEQREKFIALLQRVLNETALEPRWLEIEITETVLMENKEDIMKILKQVQEMGVGISIDDFGTGYSSMSHLKDFSVNTLKIDRSFIKDVGYDKSSKAIVKSIIALATQLNLTTVAEGVETEDQLTFILEEVCKSLQGYYFSPPVKPEEMREYLVNNKTLLMNPVQVKG